MKNTSSSPVSVLELLEPRLAPAGIVAVSTAGGVLTLTGEGLDNTVEIVSTASNVWEIKDSEAAGTTMFRLNGAQTPVSTLSLPTFQSIKATLNGGNDKLKLTDVQLNGAVTIFGNDGNDTIDISAALNGVVSVDGGNGDDNIVLSGILTNAISVKTGAGDDDVLVTGGFYGRGMTLDLGTGSNDFTMGTSSSIAMFGALNVTAAGGAANTQNILLSGPLVSITGTATLKTLAGATNLYLGSLADDFIRVNGDLKITTAAGDDLFLFSRTVGVSGLLSINAGNGTNDLYNGADTNTVGNPTLLTSLELGSFNYTGGTGADTLALDLQSLSIAGNAVVNVGAGTNELAVKAAGNSLVGGALSYVGGTGADTARLLGASFRIGGAFSMSGSSGLNRTFLVPTSGVFGSVNVTGTTGDDVFYLGAPDLTSTTQVMVLGKVVSNVGHGNADVRLTDALLHDSFSHTSTAATGDDFFIMDDSYIQGSTTVNMTGNAQAKVFINDSTFIAAVTIATGGGNDLVTFDTVTDASESKNSFYGAVNVNLGTGNDVWAAGADPSVANLGNNFFSTVKIDGGTGNDEADFIYVTGGNGSNVFNFASPVLVAVENVF